MWCKRWLITPFAYKYVTWLLENWFSIFIFIFKTIKLLFRFHTKLWITMKLYLNMEMFIAYTDVDTTCLFWLPVKQRIVFKVLTLTFKALSGECPAYLADLINVQQTRRTGLRSGDGKKLFERRCRWQWGDRSFVAAAPRLWNALPLALKESQSLQTFKKNLKSFLFEQSFM